MRGWSVYKHTFPDGKEYIGITSGSPESRWIGGRGYANQKRVFSAILRFGWDNIRHDIVASGLSEGEARVLEQEMIRERPKTLIYNTCYACNAEESTIARGDRVNSSMSFLAIEPFASDAQWKAMCEKLHGSTPLRVEVCDNGIIVHCNYVENCMFVVSKMYARFPCGGLSVESFWKWVAGDATFSEISRNETPVCEINDLIASIKC